MIGLPDIETYFANYIMLNNIRLIFSLEGKALADVPVPFYTALIFMLMVLSVIGIYSSRTMVGRIETIETGSRKYRWQFRILQALQVI